MRPAQETTTTEIRLTTTMTVDEAGKVVVRTEALNGAVWTRLGTLEKSDGVWRVTSNETYGASYGNTKREALDRFVMGLRRTAVVFLLADR